MKYYYNTADQQVYAFDPDTDYLPYVTDTMTEITEEEVDSYLPPLPEPTYADKRIEAYESKGWATPFDLIDDILSRGPEAVHADRAEIKEHFPKEEGEDV